MTDKYIGIMSMTFTDQILVGMLYKPNLVNSFEAVKALRIKYVAKNKCTGTMNKWTGIKNKCS